MDVINRLFLVKNGVPYDVAFCLEDTKVEAFCIIFGELEGIQKFDYTHWKFKEIKNE